MVTFHGSLKTLPSRAVDASDGIQKFHEPAIPSGRLWQP
jgi:hypothetical protein